MWAIQKANFAWGGHDDRKRIPFDYKGRKFWHLFKLKYVAEPGDYELYLGTRKLHT